MTREELVTEIEKSKEIYPKHVKEWGRNDADKWFAYQVGDLIDSWTAEVIGSDLEIPTGTTATVPTRSLPGNPANEHMFAFEDGFNKRGAEARKRAGLPEK